jgi:hypothetical protein
MVPSAFWVINISKVTVNLGDLGFTIRPGQYYNLLDAKHFHYTYDRLTKSLESGSLFARKNKVVYLGEEKPHFGKKEKPQMSTIPAVKPVRSVVEVVEIDYDALLFSDESYANEISELFAEEKKK